MDSNPIDISRRYHSPERRPYLYVYIYVYSSFRTIFKINNNNNHNIKKDSLRYGCVLFFKVVFTRLRYVHHTDIIGSNLRPG